MANTMTDKRYELKSYLTTLLEAIDSDFTVEDRFREDTFNASNRNARLSIMGNPVKYAEVLYTTRDSFVRSAKSTRLKTIHTFDVNVWYAYKDTGDYTTSSQITWDKIVEDNTYGLLPNFESKGRFEGTNLYTIDEIRDIQTFVIALDNTGKELAHFLGFTVDLRDNA